MFENYKLLFSLIKGSFKQYLNADELNIWWDSNWYAHDLLVTHLDEGRLSLQITYTLWSFN